jgi:hypothetical protein
MRFGRLLSLALLLSWQLARGEPLKYEFLLLPSAEGAGTFDRTVPDTQIHAAVVQADVLLTLQQGPLKLFSEYLLSNHEGDLERLQLGWQLSDDTVIWLGRFHEPGSVWNHDHHHGQYLQTSITRPAIEEWEDLGGVLPQHFTGVLVESGADVLNGWRLRMALAGGIAPQITEEGLEAFDLIHPDTDSRHQLGFQGRLSLHPNEFSESGAGLLLADDELTTVGLIEPAAATLDHVHLRLYGLFATYAHADWKVTATIYAADGRMYYTTHRHGDSFSVGYIQGEYRFAYDLTGFARWEDSIGAASSEYLKLFDRFARARQVAGLRWDFAHRQALTVQFARTHTLEGQYSDIRLQWSAAFF